MEPINSEGVSNQLFKKNEEITTFPKPRKGDSEDLELLGFADIPPDMLFPGEFNEYLKNKVKSLTEENELLKHQLGEKEKALIASKCKVSGTRANSEQNLSNFLNAESKKQSCDPKWLADMAACRILELTKQVCELTAQLEEQKDRCLMAESNFFSFFAHDEKQQSSTAVVEEQRKDTELKRVVEKLNSTRSKLFDYRNRHRQLQQELKNAYKVLQCEVGDNVNISELISRGGKSSWKGRSQQIHLLQQRVAELQEKLRKNYDNCLELPRIGNIGEPETERKASLLAAKQETLNAQQNLTENLRKLNIAKARIKVLEFEVNSFKDRVQALLEKGCRDDQIITLLQNQMKKSEENSKIQIKGEEMELKSLRDLHQNLQEELQSEKQRSSQALSAVEVKNQEIARLENLLLNLREDIRYRNNCDTREGPVEISPVVSHPQNMKSVETLTTIDTEVIKNMQKERKKLLALIAAGDRRLYAARNECEKYKNNLRLEKHRVSRLESKIARMELERIGSCGLTYRQTGCISKKLTSERTNAAIATQTTEELQDKVEMLQEEVLALRTRLDLINQEKEEDFKYFSDILMDSCNVIMPVASRSQPSISFESEMKFGEEFL